MNQNIASTINDLIDDIQGQQDIYTQEEVQKLLIDQLQNTQKLKMIQNQQELIKLIHALILQLQLQAQNNIYPNPSDFQDEKLLKLFQNKDQQQNDNFDKEGMEAIIKSQQQKIDQLQQQIENLQNQKQVQNIDIENIPQYKNMQKIIQNLQKKLEKYENDD